MQGRGAQGVLSDGGGAWVPVPPICGRGAAGRAARQGVHRPGAGVHCARPAGGAQSGVPSVATAPPPSFPLTPTHNHTCALHRGNRGPHKCVFVCSPIPPGTRIPAHCTLHRPAVNCSVLLDVSRRGKGDLVQMMMLITCQPMPRAPKYGDPKTGVTLG